ncbi:hypothetical protein [Sphingorhabdus sp.]|uniref:hypothetical protein n=1 Tax=Sphingorhabdus sp. TaxID=1902408 RepID=UPI0040486693
MVDTNPSDACRNQWIAKIADVVEHGSDHRYVWSAPQDIMRVLTPFMGSKLNYALLPTGGGQGFIGVGNSHEIGSLEFYISYSDGAFVGKVKSMTLDYFANDPAQSFFMIDLYQIPETGVYIPLEDGKKRESEELLEIRPGKYVDRIFWDRNELADGSPLPNERRLIHRYLGGRIMLVCSRSIWNDRTARHNGWHNKKSNDEIRDMIAKRM